MAQRRFAVARDFQQGGGDKHFIGCAQIAGDKQHVAIARLPHQSQQFVVTERRAERPRLRGKRAQQQNQQEQGASLRCFHEKNSLSNMHRMKNWILL